MYKLRTPLYRAIGHPSHQVHPRAYDHFTRLASWQTYPQSDSAISVSAQKGRLASEPRCSIVLYSTGLGDLANRWPRHIVEAVKETLKEEGAGKDGEKFVTLSADSGRSSSSDKAGSLPDLSAQPVGGQTVRPNDAAESPITAFDSQKESTNVSAAKPVYVRNIAIPAKPSPPGAEDCCMSGCARCVYDLYAEDLQDYQKDLSAARAKIMALQPPFDMTQWNENLLGPRPKEQGMAHDETGADKRTAEEKAQDEVDAVIGQLDPSMKAFLQLERKLKRKGQHPTSSQDKKQTESATSA